MPWKSGRIMTVCLTRPWVVLYLVFGWPWTKIGCQMRNKVLKKNLNVWTCNIYIVLIWRRKKHNFIFLTKDNFGWHQPFLVAYSDWQPIIDCSYFKLGFCPSQTWLPKFEIGCHRGHLSVTLGDSHLWTYLCVVMAALNLLSPYNEKVWNLLVHLEFSGAVPEVFCSESKKN